MFLVHAIYNMCKHAKEIYKNSYKHMINTIKKAKYWYYGSLEANGGKTVKSTGNENNCLCVI